jgi:hypothetical protein
MSKYWYPFKVNEKMFNASERTMQRPKMLLHDQSMRGKILLEDNSCMSWSGLEHFENKKLRLPEMSIGAANHHPRTHAD